MTPSEFIQMWNGAKSPIRVRILSDDWADLDSDVGTLVDPQPVKGSSQCVVRLASGAIVTVSRNEIEVVKRSC